MCDQVLTRSERRVATLASEGLSSHAIARLPPRPPCGVLGKADLYLRANLRELQSAGQPANQVQNPIEVVGSQ